MSDSAISKPEDTSTFVYAGEKLTPIEVSCTESLTQDIGVHFDEQGLVPAIVQQLSPDGVPAEVLMMAWMNKESLARTLQTRTTWFWSRSRNELWNKGATSGNIQQVQRVLFDCDADCLLILVDSPGPACHTGHRSCFYREMHAASR